MSESNKVGVCPWCGGDIVPTEKIYGCSNWRDKDGGCKFAVMKAMSGKEITIDVVKLLLTEGKTEKMTGFVSKKGDSFDAAIVVNEKGTSNYGVSFKFD